MKRYLLLPLLCAAVSAAAAWGVVYWNAGRCQSSSGIGRSDDAAWLTRTLGLDDGQQAAVRAACADYAAELKRCSATHAAARCALSCRLFEPNVTAADLDGEAEALCRAQLAAEKATVAHFRRVHSVLTPEQQARYEAVVRTCVCGGATGAACDACCGRKTP